MGKNSVASYIYIYNGWLECGIVSLYACVCASLMERFGDGNVGFLEV